MTNTRAIEILALALADMISTVGDDVSQQQADEWMTAIRVFDSTDSGPAAWVRDALRDNCNVNV